MTGKVPAPAFMKCLQGQTKLDCDEDLTNEKTDSYWWQCPWDDVVVEEIGRVRLGNGQQTYAVMGVG